MDVIDCDVQKNPVDVMELPPCEQQGELAEFVYRAIADGARGYVAYRCATSGKFQIVAIADTVAELYKAIPNEEGLQAVFIDNTHWRTLIGPRQQQQEDHQEIRIL